MSIDRSQNLNLPFISAAQAQKHITHNEALRLLDLLTHLYVLTDQLTEPPAQPNVHATYLIPTDPAGEWSGKTDKIAIYNGQWDYIAPQPGWLCYISETSNLKIWNGVNWQKLSDHLNLDEKTFSKLGVNMSADQNNKFALASETSLFSHNGQDHRLKINKAGDANVASVLFQSDYNGQAEIGLNGSAHFSIKTSSDGVNFEEAVRINNQTGKVSFARGLEEALSGADIASYVPCSVSQVWRLDQARQATPRTYQVQSVSSDILTLTDPVAGTVFDIKMEGQAMVRVWNMSKTPYESCWIKAYISDTELRVHNSNDLVNWNPNDQLQLGDPAGSVGSGLNTLGMVAVDISPFLNAVFGRVFYQKALNIVLRIEASGGVGRLGVSATGASGSAFDGYSLSDGQPNSVSFTVPTSVSSPISESNLLYIREPLDTASLAHGINFIRVVGVWL